MKFILGSNSFRRKEIMEFFTLPFIQIPSKFDEESVAFHGDPVSYAQELSAKKAESLHLQYPKELILTADTVVFFEGKIYNKPKNNEDALAMLQAFSGKWQSVITGVTVQKNGTLYTGYEETKVLFNSLSEEEIRLYHLACPCLDKAGAYGIQGAGSILVSQIQGCYYNVMGLPINTVTSLFKKCGIDLWKYIKPC